MIVNWADLFLASILANAYNIKCEASTREKVAYNDLVGQALMSQFSDL